MQPTTLPARGVAAIMADWKDTAEALRAILPGPQAAIDPQARKQIAPIALPLLRQSVVLADEMYHSDPAARERSRKLHYQMLAVMTLLGDPDAQAELDDARQSNRKDIALLGRHAWYLAQWWSNVEDPTRSAKVLDEIEQLAIAAPKDDDLTIILLQMREEGTAGKSQDQRMQAIITGRLQGPMAHHVTGQFKAAEKRRSLIDKPLVIAGATLDGKPFSTTSLRGKRVIVHFGATWCGPWQQEHNALLQQFAAVSDRLAIVTVLCDKPDQDVEIYQQRHKEIPWPVLRDRTNPLAFAAEFGVEDLPTTIIIGPDGTVEQVDVTPNLKLLQALLAQSEISPTTTRATRVVTQ